MLTKIITPRDHRRYSALLEQMYELRYRVFVEKLGWTLPNSSKGIERDQFDNEKATYIIVHQGVGKEKIFASLRINPTSTPTLLTTTFRWIVDVDLQVGPDIWDGTRLVANPDLTAGESKEAVATLLATTFSYGAEHSVSAIVSVSDPILERVLGRLGLAPRRLGSVKTVQPGVKALALRMECNHHVADRVWLQARKHGGHSQKAVMAA